ALFLICQPKFCILSQQQPQTGFKICDPLCLPFTKGPLSSTVLFATPLFTTFEVSTCQCDENITVPPFRITHCNRCGLRTRHIRGRRTGSCSSTESRTFSW